MVLREGYIAQGVLEAICKTNQHVPPTLTKGEASASTPTEQAEMLNRHFVSCYSTDSVDTSALPPAAADTPALSSVDISSMDVFRGLATMRSKVAFGHDAEDNG